MITNQTTRNTSLFAVCVLAVFLISELRPCLANTPTVLSTIVVEGKLQTARNKISPALGATTYRIEAPQITGISRGENTPFNQILLRSPGVVQDSFGQVHLRGEHADLQYRINGFLLPEGLSGFGQELDTRFLKSLQIITGALPAQYGFHTAGIVDIQTKNGVSTSENTYTLSVGGPNTFHPGLTLGNTNSPLSWHVNSSYLQNDMGIENPTNATQAHHDGMSQFKGFGNISCPLDDTSSVTSLFSLTSSHFQIPNTPDIPAGVDANGNPFPGLIPVDSTNLDEKQDEQNSYLVLGYQKTWGDLDIQLSQFNRSSDIFFHPDKPGDMYFNGVASQVNRKTVSNGLEGNSAYTLNDEHTLRTGFLAKQDSVQSNTTTTVFATDVSGNATGNSFDIVDNASPKGYFYSLYLQDEWTVSNLLTINAGVRADAVNSTITQSQISPRINTTYKLSKNTMVHAGYAQYFTPPPLDLVRNDTLSKYTDTTNAPQITQNESVKPERADYFDLGITHQVFKNLQIGLNAYNKTATNLLDEGQFGQALILSPFNYKTGKIMGIEGTMTYSQDRFSAYANLAWSQATGREIVSGQFLLEQDELDYAATHDIFLDHSQTWTASIGASYSLENIRFYGDILFGSGLRKGFANTEVLPGYMPVSIGIESPVGPFIARLDIANLFDQTYQLRDGSGIGVGASQYGARRSIYLSLEVK